MEKIRGTVSFVIYPKGEGNYDDFRIVKFRVQGKNGKVTGEITARGPIPISGSDTDIELIGRWVKDPKFGDQFEVSAAERLIPKKGKELAAFLAAEIDGIGPARAQKILDRFGDQTYKVISEQPELLSEIPGITPGAISRIKDSWQKATDEAYTSARMWLLGKGVSTAYASRIVEHFAGATIDILSTNPYRATEVDRVGFTVADELAKNLGWSKDSQERADVAAVHIVQSACYEEGQTFLFMREFLDKMRKSLQLDEKTSREALARQAEAGLLKVEQIPSVYGTDEAVYLPHMLEAEERLAKWLVRLQGFKHEPPSRLESSLEAAQQYSHKKLSPDQIRGIRNAFAHRVSGVTGGPGTGKTELTKTLVRTAEQLGLRCCLAAPTGRAAKRLSEATGRQAATIHRMLEFDPKEGTFGRHRARPLDADIVVVDEASMLELVLGHKLVDAVPDHASLIFIGDSDQLPAVGAGTVLKDLITSGVVKFTKLETIFRQAENSDIIKNAHRIRKGEEPQFLPKGTVTDCYLMPVSQAVNPSTGKKTDDIAFVKGALERLCKEDIPRKTGVDPIRDVQILIPMRIGDAGTREINTSLQQALNPDGTRVPGTPFRVGDRVMQFRNNYKNEVFNGDIGFIQSFDEEAGTVTVDFDGRKVACSRKDLEEIQLAYAQTIHKSQGSEYPVVVVVMLIQHYRMLDRNLLYTATTRAKTMCLYLASKRALKIAASTQNTSTRNSLLAYRLRKAKGDGDRQAAQ